MKIILVASLTAVITATRVLSLSSLAFLQTLSSTSLSRADPDIRPDIREGWAESLKYEERSENLRTVAPRQQSGHC